MSHHTEADFASSELARMFVASPNLCYPMTMMPGPISANATFEPSSSGWPKSDGIVSIFESSSTQRDIAIEYKRRNEGIHGLLTAIGQAHAYIHKGYSGAAIIIPDTYLTHSTPANYVKEVLDQASSQKGIGVFSYDPPDLANSMPFSGKITCIRPLEIISSPKVVKIATQKTKTQWVHMREGSTTRDGFLKFIQIAKVLSSGISITHYINPDLIAAAMRISPGTAPEDYISNVTNNRFLSLVWREFWFLNVLTKSVSDLFFKDSSGVYHVPTATTNIEKDDGTGKSVIFQGRTSGLKEYIVDELNSGKIGESEAWEIFLRGVPATGTRQGIQGIRDRAHSYREDMDSSLAQLEWIDGDGKPTDRGLKYASICERYGGASSVAAIDYMSATLLKTGGYATFLHYIHRLSEEFFSANPYEFTKIVSGIPKFTEDSYWEYLNAIEEKMINDLRVIRKASMRSRPRRRTEFQVELTLLRRYGFINADRSMRYRLGVGVPINWERVNEVLSVEL